MIILSIDPGFGRMGVAIIKKENRGSKEELLYSDCFETGLKENIYDRFLKVGQEVARVIKKYKPEILAMENLFMTNNQKTVMNVSQARGIIIYEAKKAGLDVVEYTPPQIKIAITGYGKADKSQVYNMVKKLINLDSMPAQTGKKRLDDEVDAIAVGLTAFAHIKF